MNLAVYAAVEWSKQMNQAIRKKQERRPIELCMAAVQLTMRKPRTARELAELLGISAVCARNYLYAMEEEGLVKRSTLVRREGAGSFSYLFTWTQGVTQ